MKKIVKLVDELDSYEEIANTLFTKVSTTTPDHTNLCVSYPQVDDAVREYLVRWNLYSILNDEQIMNIRLCCSRLVDFSKAEPTMYLRFNPNTEPYTLLFEIMDSTQQHIMSDVCYDRYHITTRVMKSQVGWLTWNGFVNAVNRHDYALASSQALKLQNVFKAIRNGSFNEAYSLSDWLMDNGFKAIDLVYSVNSTFKGSKLSCSDVAEIGVIQTDDPVKDVQRIQNALFLFVYDPDVFPKFYYGCEKCIPPNATPFWQLYLTTNPKRYAFTNVTYKELP